MELSFNEKGKILSAATGVGACEELLSAFNQLFECVMRNEHTRIVQRREIFKLKVVML